MKYIKYLIIPIVLIFILFFININNFKHHEIIKPIKTMMREADYYYKAYQMLGSSTQKINKQLMYKDINIKSCKEYDKNVTINNLTKCIIEANKKNGIIDDTNMESDKFNEYYESLEEGLEKELLSELYTEVYYLLMYEPTSFKDYKQYYDQTVKKINVIYGKLNIPEKYYY